MEPSYYQEDADLNVYPEDAKQVSKIIDDSGKPTMHKRGSRIFIGLNPFCPTCIGTLALGAGAAGLGALGLGALGAGALGAGALGAGALGAGTLGAGALGTLGTLGTLQFQKWRFFPSFC